MGPATNPVDLCKYYGKVYTAGCVLKSYPDDNQNMEIPWKDWTIGKSIIRLKGVGATLEIQNRYDAITKRMVTLDH